MKLRILLPLYLAFFVHPVLHAQTDWRTPTELSDYRTTPDYAATVAYLERIAAAAPHQVRIENFGKTGEGRDLKIVIASKDGNFDPAAIHASGRVILLVQNSIHAGEMDGKDACLALLRDLVITKEKAALLDRVVLVFIPVYNIDGHERRSAFNRINQNGPEEMGWRANATNLNLNRDYMKADAPETRALLALINKWRPDFFVDDHVTDGADFQYDVTFSIDDSPANPPATVDWIHQIAPEIATAIDKTGHLAFPSYIMMLDEADPSRGLAFNDFSPRFSTNQVALNNRPAMLVELHMLKDYKTRVTGNSELIAALMATLNRDAQKLIALNTAADEAAEKLPALPAYPLTFAWNGRQEPVLFHGYKFTTEPSEISGTRWIRYSHELWNQSIPMRTGFKTVSSITPPAGYIIPRQWTPVIDVLSAHGVEMKTLTADSTVSAGSYLCSGFTWQQRSYEGRHPLFAEEYDGPSDGNKSATCTLSNRQLTIPAGSIFVPLNQRLSQVAIHWLEPMAPDSALSWGFFDPIFEQKEYGEGYVLEKLAREMLAKDPALKAEFDARLKSDPRFAASPYARLSFFYEHSPWYQANRIGQYPVLRLNSLDGLNAR